MFFRIFMKALKKVSSDIYIERKRELNKQRNGNIGYSACRFQRSKALLGRSLSLTLGIGTASPLGVRTFAVAHFRYWDGFAFGC